MPRKCWNDISQLSHLRSRTYIMKVPRMFDVLYPNWCSLSKRSQQIFEIFDNGFQYLLNLHPLRNKMWFVALVKADIRTVIYFYGYVQWVLYPNDHVFIHSDPIKRHVGASGLTLILVIHQLVVSPAQHNQYQPSVSLVQFKAMTAPGAKCGMLHPRRPNLILLCYTVPRISNRVLVIFCGIEPMLPLHIKVTR